MNSNIRHAQLQIKSFNKYLARHLEGVSDSKYEVITDLIGENMTASGFGKAGAKFLESMSNEELLSYLSDLEAARELVKMDEELSELAKEFIFEDDPKAGLWKMYQQLEDMGYAFDSDQVKDIVDGKVEADYKTTIIEMSKIISDDYGVSDFTDYYNSLPVLD